MAADSPDKPADRPTAPPARPTLPKSADRIRSTLAAIHEQAPSGSTVGPLADGLKPDDSLVIATFHDRDVRRRFQELLMAHGIASTIGRSGGRDEVLVDAVDRERAARLLDEHLLADPDRLEARGRRVVDFVLFGAAIGATISVCFVVDRNLARMKAELGHLVAVVIAFAIYGGLVGGLLGAIKERLATQGCLQFTILDLLLLSALTALAALAWRTRLGL